MLRTGMGSADSTAAYQTSLLQTILANQGTPVPPAPVSSGYDLSGFLAKYGIWIELGLGLMMFFRPGGRR